MIVRARLENLMASSSWSAFLRKSAALLLLSLLLVSKSVAEDKSEHSSGDVNPSAHYDPVANYREAKGYLIDSQNRRLLGMGTVALLVAYELDDEVRAAWAKQQRLGSLEVLGNDVLGTGVPGALLGATFWAWGAVEQNSYALAAGQAQIEALVATGVLTAALKGISQRERPDHSDRYSFPSAHTSTVSASAITLTEFFGWPAALVAYPLVAVTALARVADDRHWLSDTVGGLMVGSIVGHAVSRMHKERVSSSEQDLSSSRIYWVPVVETDALGLVVAISFQ